MIHVAQRFQEIAWPRHLCLYDRPALAAAVIRNATLAGFGRRARSARPIASQLLASYPGGADERLSRIVSVGVDHGSGAPIRG
jgi:hypothetical protein